MMLFQLKSIQNDRCKTLTILTFYQPITFHKRQKLFFFSFQEKKINKKFFEMIKDNDLFAKYTSDKKIVGKRLISEAKQHETQING